MDTIDITPDTDHEDLVAAAIVELVKIPPDRAEGWRTLDELHNLYMAKATVEMTRRAFLRALTRRTQNGELEKRTVGNVAYFRKVKND